MTHIVQFPTTSYAKSLEPNAPLLVLLDADLARKDVYVDLARRKITVRGAINAARAAEQLWDEIRAQEQRLNC